MRESLNDAMARTTSKITIVSVLLTTFALWTALAQETLPAGNLVAMPQDEGDAATAPYIIFSNLDRDPASRYQSSPFLAAPVVGKRAFNTEEWQAIRFVPVADAQATILSAAVHYTSGTRLVQLGIYSDNGFGTVGSPLPGGQGTTTQIPDAGECCQLANVTLAGGGVTLTAGTPYWLVVNTDDINGADFVGGWQLSVPSRTAGIAPPLPWVTNFGNWRAAQIRGTVLQGRLRSDVAAQAAAANGSASSSNSIIFTNLDRAESFHYLAGQGAPIAGSSVSTSVEVWEALPFTPRTDQHAKTISAAIAYISGTKLLNLGIYSDANGTVGTPLPGGQGSTTDIPTLGECCPLTTITLADPGVALIKGTQYWLVATTDDVNAPTFYGAWQASTLATNAYSEPESFNGWTPFTASWFAAEIRGTKP